MVAEESSRPNADNMSTIVDTTSLSTANLSDINVPVNFDNTPIQWDGNDGSIEGALHQFGLWSTREDRYETLFEPGQDFEMWAPVRCSRMSEFSS